MSYSKIFWPKKMRMLVEEYQRKGILNRKAVIHFQNLVQKHASILGIIALFFWAMGHEYFALFLAVATPFGIKYEIHRSFRNEVLPYTLGEKRQVRFIRAGSGLHGLQGIYYEEIDTFSQSHTTIAGGKIVKKEDFPDAGDLMTVYQDVDRKYHAMPDVPYLKKIYCLHNREFKK
jgi:hypothetical protein